MSCPRTTNGCSGGVSWFYRIILGSPPCWEYCCDEHDLAYDEGGTAKDRSLADRRLRDCLGMAGYPVRGWIYWVAVRLFGGSHFNWC